MQSESINHDCFTCIEYISLKLFSFLLTLLVLWKFSNILLQISNRIQHIFYTLIYLLHLKDLSSPSSEQSWLSACTALQYYKVDKNKFQEGIVVTIIISIAKNINDHMDESPSTANPAPSSSGQSFCPVKSPSVNSRRYFLCMWP